VFSLDLHPTVFRSRFSLRRPVIACFIAGTIRPSMAEVLLRAEPYAFAQGGSMRARNTNRVATAAVAAVAALAALPRPAAADPITLTVKSGPSLQQTQNRPCVIG